MNTVTSSPIGLKSQFDYGNIPEALQNEAEAVVSSVRVSLGKINTQALELARQIHRIQEQFPSKQFKAWLNYYFPDAESQIRNWLKIVELAERLPEYVEQMMGWGTSAIAALSYGSDELAKSVLSGSEKLSKAAIKALISEERGESKPPASSHNAGSKSDKQQVSEIAIQLAKLTAHKVDLQKQLTQSVTREAEEQLRYHIRQAELEIQQLCEEFDPAQIGVAAMIQKRTHDSNVNTESEEFQRLRSQLESEQRNKAELLERIEKLEQEQYPSVKVDFSESEEFQKMQSLTIELRSQKSELINRIQQLENQLTQQQSPSAEVDFSESSEYQYFQSLTAELKSHLQAERQKSVELSKQLEQLQQQFAQQQRSSQNAEAISSDSQEFKRMRSLAVELQSQKAKLSNRVQQLERQLVQKQQFPKADLKLSESEELKRMRSLAVELQSQKAQLSNRVQQLEQQQSNSVEVNFSESEELEKMQSLTIELRSQLESERQSKAELSERIEKLEQEQCPIVEVDFSESSEYQKMRSLTVELRSQLESEREKNQDLSGQLEQIQLDIASEKIEQAYSQPPKSLFECPSEEQIEIEQLRCQLQERDQYITQLQNQEPPEDVYVFKPKFAPAKLEELQLDDRIRIISPNKKTVNDDIVLRIDRYDRRHTKWSGMLSNQEEEAGWTFERMTDIERVQSKFNRLQETNRQLKEQIAELEGKPKPQPPKTENELEIELRSTHTQLRKQTQKLEELNDWKEVLQKHQQQQLRPGLEVEILYDPKGITTGTQGTVEGEFECSPGQWWISFVNPDTQKIYRQLYWAYQLYLSPS
ncbi:MAG: hypothetical protein AAFO04_27480 [Cyanobacteria bacterium J06592_8]